MDPLPPPELARRFAALQAHFRAGLPARQAEIEAAHRDAAAQPRPQALIVALHRLAGAAASFGFPALGAAARAAEFAARDEPGVARAQRLGEALAALRHALAEAQAPPRPD